MTTNKKTVKKKITRKKKAVASQPVSLSESDVNKKMDSIEKRLKALENPKATKKKIKKAVRQKRGTVLVRTPALTRGISSGIPGPTSETFTRGKITDDRIKEIERRLYQLEDVCREIKEQLRQLLQR